MDFTRKSIWKSLKPTWDIDCKSKAGGNLYEIIIEYGAGLMAAELPDTTDIFIPGETVPDPACIPEDRLVEETLKSIRNPMGMEPLSELAHKGSKVTIISRTV